MPCVGTHTRRPPPTPTRTPHTPLHRRDRITARTHGPVVFVTHHPSVTALPVHHRAHPLTSSPVFATHSHLLASDCVGGFRAGAHPAVPRGLRPDPEVFACGGPSSPRHPAADSAFLEMVRSQGLAGAGPADAPLETPALPAGTASTPALALAIAKQESLGLPGAVAALGASGGAGLC